MYISGMMQILLGEEYKRDRERGINTQLLRKLLS